MGGGGEVGVGGGWRGEWGWRSVRGVCEGRSVLVVGEGGSGSGVRGEGRSVWVMGGGGWVEGGVGVG